MEEETRFCPNCSRPVSGRIDKKFCSDECRTMFNNRVYRKRYAGLKHINRILRHNRAVIESLYDEGIHKTSPARLLKLGFDFSYMTSMNECPESESGYKIGCYEYTYFIASDGSVNIDRAEPTPL